MGGQIETFKSQRAQTTIKNDSQTVEKGHALVKEDLRRSDEETKESRKGSCQTLDKVRQRSAQIKDAQIEKN